MQSYIFLGENSDGDTVEHALHYPNDLIAMVEVGMFATNKRCGVYALHRTDMTPVYHSIWGVATGW